MRISARTEYALLALLQLVQAKDAQPIQSKDIAARASIPKPFLDQLLLDLRRAGLVRSVRGPGGGYVLARAPDEITIRDSVAAVEGGALATQCGLRANDGVPCHRAAACALSEVWKRVDDSTNQILTGYTLAQLFERQAQIEGRQMYYI
jgi:Rrf2 family protein